MSLINVTDLTFAYEGSSENIFENVNFQIDTNWKLGFIGRNGRGKTTFLNLLMGKYEYKGNISASVEFEYFPFEVKNERRNAIEIAEDICGDYVGWQIERELSMLEADRGILYRPFNTLSKGEQTKVMLASLFVKENSFLLIDEPTNHLDMRGREVLGKYLNKKKGFILVSHDRSLLDSCVDYVLSLNRENIEIQRGNFSSWLLNKERQDSFELAENKKLAGELKRLKKASKETAVWSERVEKTKFGTANSGSKADRGYIGHKAAKMMKRSKTIEGRQRNAIEEKSKLLKNIESDEDLKISPLIYHKERLLTLENVSVKYGGNTVCSNVNFTLERGDRAAVTGRNGSGKSSILKLICGENIEYEGTLIKGSGIIISYVSQDTSFLKGNLSEYAENSNIDESLFKAILRKMDFSREQFDKNIENFSGGQKKKVLIAKSLCEKAHIYIWDEPLNFIDVISRMQIERLIREFEPTMLFVEHDRTFCENVSNKKVVL